MSPVPSVTFRSELPPVVRKELDQLDSELTEYLLKEHDDDGHHGHITALSIKPHGPGPLQIPGPVNLTSPVTIDGQPVAGGGAAPAAHHVTHEPGGSDALVNVAWKNLANTFVPLQTFNAGLAAGGPLTTSSNIGASDYINTTSGYYEKGRAAMLGHWVDVPFAASNFSASGAMVWTAESGDVISYAYSLIGQTMLLTFQINGTTVSGTRDVYLKIKLPAGVVPTRAFEAFSHALDIGVFTPVRLRLFAGDPWVSILRSDFANWGLSTNNTFVFGQLAVPI